MKLPLALIAFVLSSLLALPCLGQSGESSTEQALERIAYSSYRPAGWDLYLYDESGSEPRRLTDHPALDYDAVFSPDGRWIVFTSERDGNPSLYALDREQPSAPRRLVRSTAMQDQATISPDGRWIAFVSTHTGNADIYVLPFVPDSTQDVSDAANLTEHPGGDFRPTFSPDGNRIAFSSDRDGSPSRHPAFPFALQHEGDIYVMSREGEDLQRVTDSPGWDGSPAWSADGTTLYFYSERDEHLPYRIYSVALGSGGPQPVSPADLPALSPAIRGDGRVIFATWTEQGPSKRWQARSIGLEGEVRDESTPGIDCLNPQVHRGSGAMVCHGGLPFEGETVADFPGPLLVAGSPQIFELAGQRVLLTGIRHAFTAPPHPSMDEVLFRETPRRIGLVSGTGEAPSGLLDLDDLSERPIGAISHLRYTRDGSWISFTVGPFAGAPQAEADVWRMRSDGTGLTNLTPDAPGNDGLAVFAPDGSRFVFRSGRTGNFDIYLADGDGSSLRNLTNHPASETFPALSPHGDQVAFVSDRNGVLDEPTGRRTFDVYTLDLGPDGTPGALRQITRNASQDAHVGYSPDGAWLIYTSGKGGLNDEAPLVQEVLFNPQMYGEIYAYRLRDSATVRLTHNKWEDGAPVWTTPARSEARPPVAEALDEVLERAGADSAAVRYRELQQTASTAYRFGAGGLYRLAHRYLREGNPDAAEESFRLLTLLQPESVRAYLEMGDAFLARGDTASAVQQYRNVLARDAEHLRAEWMLFRVEAEGYTGVAVAPEKLDAYAGTYKFRAFEVVISEEEGRLLVQLPMAPSPFPLHPLSDTRFFVGMIPQPMLFTFVLNEETVPTLEVKHSGGVEKSERIE